MGQRTQIIVTANISHSFNDKKEVITRVYHNQWGFSKMQLQDVINLLNTYIGYNDFEFPQRLHKAYLEEEEWQTINGDCSIERAMYYFNHEGDNDNGGVLVKLNIIDSSIESGKLYIFNDPESEEFDEVNRYISLNEYIALYPNYFDFDFYEMFRACLRYHNIKLIEPEQEE